MAIPRFASWLRHGGLVVGLIAPAAVTGAADRAASAPRAVGGADPVAALIGDAACDDPGQCRTIGIGAKACGGPSAYLAWSIKRTDAAALKAAVAIQADAERAEQRERGIVSDCRVVREPVAVCRPRPEGGGKSCQLGPGGARSAV